MNVNEKKIISKWEKNELLHLFIANTFYYLVLIFTVAYFAVLPLRNTQIRHIIVLCGSVCIYVLAINRIAITKYKIPNFIGLCFIFLQLLFCGFLLDEVTLDNAYNCLNFFAMYVILTTNNDMVMTERMKNWLHWAFVLIGILLFITAQTSAAYLFENGTYSGSLALGMTNPNLTAIMIACVIGLLLIFYPNTKYKIIHVVLMVVLLYLIWLCDSRASIIVVAIMAIYSIFFRNHRINNFLIIMAIVVPMLFPILYIYIFKHISSTYELLGKDLFSGRQNIYLSRIKLLDSPIHVLFGNYKEIQFANAHNAPLTILCALGVVGFLICYFSYSVKLMKINKHISTPEARVALIIIMCMYLQSSAEALMFTGVFPSISFMFFFMVLADET